MSQNSVIAANIAGRNTAEEALKESEENFAKVFRSAPVSLAISTLSQGRFVDVNEAYCRITGYSREEVVGMSSLDLGFWKDPAVREQIVATLQKDEAVHELEAEFVFKNGREAVGLISMEIIELGGEKCLLSMVNDITDRKRAEEALRESEERYRRIYNETPAMLHSIDREGRLVSVSNYWVEAMGYSREEVLGRRSTEFLTEESRRFALETVLPAYFRTGFCKDVPYQFVKKNGEIMDVLLSATAERDEKGEVTRSLAVITDVTALNRAKEELRQAHDELEQRVLERTAELARANALQKKLEQQVLQSQKMDSIGLLAGGIAHDFNNILSGIIGYAEMLQTQIDGNDLVKTCLEQILSISERAVNLTRSLLAFSRKQEILLRPVLVNDAIKRVQKFLSRVIGEDIELRTSLAPGLLTVMADSGQFDQVMMNLAANARDAMPGGGVLTINTERVYLDDEFIRYFGSGQAGDYALISVADTGCGMDDVTRERIFEPFFTTKEEGKGTGLGLSIVYGIIKQHNGFIDVVSAPGGGTVFKLYLPLVEGGVEETAKAAESVAEGGRETVLVVEDDGVVRTMLQDILTEVGYTVLTASTAEKALEMIEDHGEAIRLLVADLVLPKMSGKELFEQAALVNPALKVIFTTGYAGEVLEKKGLVEEGVILLLKPFSRNDLLHKVRKVLGE